MVIIIAGSISDKEHCKNVLNKLKEKNIKAKTFYGGLSEKQKDTYQKHERKIYSYIFN